MKMKQTAYKIHTRRIVTTQRGSWKWQDAFRVVDYRARLLPDGRVLWESMGNTGKYSEPQLREMGFSNLLHGSLHNKPVSAEKAIESIGARMVQKIEENGWNFSRKAT